MVDGFTILDNPPGYREQKFWIWTALAAEAKGVLFWQYRPEMVGPESPGWGIVHPDGSLTERAQLLRETGQVLEQYGAELAAARTPRSQVAILFDPEVALMQQAENSPELFASSMKGYHRLLWEQNIGCDFLSVRDIARLGEYRLVIMPFPALIKNDSVPHLRRYVEQGGQLWAEAYLGRYGDQWTARTAVPPPGLDDLFGLRFGEAMPARHITMVVPSGEAVTIDDGFILERLEPSPASTVLGWSDSARQVPLAIERSVGSGRTFFIGTLFGRGYFQMRESPVVAAWFLERLRSMGIQSACRVSPPDSGVRCRLIRTDTLAYLICANHGSSVFTEICISLPFPVTSAAEVYAASECEVGWIGGDLHVHGHLGAKEVWVVRVCLKNTEGAE